MLEGLTPAQNRSVYCKIDMIKSTLEPEDQKILETSVNDYETWSSKGLSKALRERGISVADTTITKHRERLCACYR